MDRGRKIALLLEYDGTAFHGFQVQANAPTVQRVVEEALHQITGEGNRIKGASRTDAGVHAVGQVASFVTGSAHRPETFGAALNYHLPEQVAVCQTCEVDLDFDPRRHATSRSYRYWTLNRPSPSPLVRTYSLWVRDPLDVEAMDEAARELVGQHDLASFSGPLSTPQTSTVRQVYRAEVGKEGPWVYFDIEANAFLPQQVRRTMGALLAIGRGQHGPEWVRLLRNNPSLGAADKAAPAQGLYLMRITYPEGKVTFEPQAGSGGVLPLFATIRVNRGTS